MLAFLFSVSLLVSQLQPDTAAGPLPTDSEAAPAAASGCCRAAAPVQDATGGGKSLGAEGTKKGDGADVVPEESLPELQRPVKVWRGRIEVSL